MTWNWSTRSRSTGCPGSAVITAVTLDQLRDVHPRPVVRADGGQGVGERQARGPLRLSRRQIAHPPGVGAAGRGRPVRRGALQRLAAAGPITVGRVGFEELTDGALVAGQPNGAASWFPCDDHPSAKAGFRIPVSTESPYLVVANGTLVSRRPARGADGVDLRAARTDVHLSSHPADRRVRDHPAGRRRCRYGPRCPARLRRNSTTTSRASPT